MQAAEKRAKALAELGNVEPYRSPHAPAVAAAPATEDISVVDERKFFEVRPRHVLSILYTYLS